MAFTAGELTNIANAALDFYYNKGDTFKQSIQAKPLLAPDGEQRPSPSPAARAISRLAVKGDYGAGGVNDHVVGYTHNDTVNFYTPANIQRVNYPWREHHIGLTLTHTELKIDGISVTDDAGDGSSLSNHSDRDVTVLVNLLQDKLEDFGEQYARTHERPAVGRRHRRRQGAGRYSVDHRRRAQRRQPGRPGARDQHLVAEPRGHGGVRRGGRAGRGDLGADQRRRAAAVPAAGIPPADPLWRPAVEVPRRQLDFISAMEIELRANGNYSMTGFTGPQDGSMGR